MNITHHIVDTSTVHVVDGALAAAELQRTHALCRMLPFTRVRYGYRADSSVPLSFDYQWIHPVAQDERALLPLTTLQSLVSDLVGEQWSPGRVHINCITPGERRHKHIDGAKGKVLVAVCFANSEWKDEWSGDLVFFEGDHEVARIRPMPGRVVVFDGSLVHRGGVPVSDCPEVRYAIAHKFLGAA